MMNLSEQQKWVNDTLNSMSMEEIAGQLLCPEDRKYSMGDWENIFREVPVGCVFFGTADSAASEAAARLIQSRSRFPVVVAADLERGAVALNQETHFPYQMALGACDSAELAWQMGRITALEGRARGIHWTFSPVVDLNLNFENPVTGVRSLGDDPARTIPLLQGIVRGLQEEGLIAATVKHFPGDGVDNRDQHMLTSINSLPFEQWMELYGKVWLAAFEAGAMSVMAGHIALPDFQGMADDCDNALPATLCSKIQIDLLRGKLGFDGVLVSDAMPMTGITSRVPENELAWRNIAAGSDVVLFANPRKDFEYLMAALRSGNLTEERVVESARRVLTMKAKLNLPEDCFGKVPTVAMAREHDQIAEQVAERSVTALRTAPGLLPLGKGVRKVMTVTLSDPRSTLPKELPLIDEELKKRGIEVDHHLNPNHDLLMAEIHNYDMVFVNMIVLPHAGFGSLRLSKDCWMPFWRGFYAQAPEKVVFTSFGSPYLLHEIPAATNMLGLYSGDDRSQRAAVKAWFGEIPIQGKSPVRAPKTRIQPYK